MPHAVINGARLWYDIMGEGEPLLLHHGFTACRRNWMPIAERLQNRYQVILMECRGTGDSEHTEDGYNIPQYALDVLGLMDELDIEKFTFGGHSMGGGMGYQLGVDHRERLQRLILMAPIPSGGIQPADQTQRDATMAARVRGDREFFMTQQRMGRFRNDVQTESWMNHRVDQMLNVSDGHLTGGVDGTILGQAAKIEALHHYADKFEITSADVLAVGDGANDLGMLNLAGAGVALHAKPSVAAQCDLRVNFGDLSALLFLQGYARSEFITPEAVALTA